MPRSLFYAGVAATLTAALISFTRGFELLAGFEIIPWFDSTAPGSLFVLFAVLTMAAFFLRIAVSVLIRDLFAGIVAAISIMVVLISESIKVSVAAVLNADVILPLSYLSAVAVALLLLSIRSYFDLRLGQVSWVLATPSIFLLGTLLIELVLGYNSNVFYSPFLLGLGLSLGLIAGHGLGHRRLFFEPVTLRAAVVPQVDDSLDLDSRVTQGG